MRPPYEREMEMWTNVKTQGKAKGETILLCRRNQPIAEIRPIAPKRKKPRPMGLDRGKIKIGPEFFEPLPDELLALFNGEKP